jgi:hypothetical protein
MLHTGLTFVDEDIGGWDRTRGRGTPRPCPEAGDQGRRAHRLGAVGICETAEKRVRATGGWWSISPPRPLRRKRRRQLRRWKRGRKVYEAARLPQPNVLGCWKSRHFWASRDTFLFQKKNSSAGGVAPSASPTVAVAVAATWNIFPNVSPCARRPVA